MKKSVSKIFIYSLMAFTYAGAVWASPASQEEEKQKNTEQTSNNPPQDPSNVPDKVKKETNRAVDDIRDGADKLGKGIEKALSKDKK